MTIPPEQQSEMESLLSQAAVKLQAVMEMLREQNGDTLTFETPTLVVVVKRKEDSVVIHPLPETFTTSLPNRQN